MATAFIAGCVLGGLFCGFIVYMSCREKINLAMDALRELNAKYMELNARLETLRLFYGVKESDDV